MSRPPIIDTHQHFIKADRFPYTWAAGDWAPLHKDFLPKDLQPELSACGVAGTVTVQADQCVDETRFLLELAKRHGFILGVVGWVDLVSPTVGEILDELAANRTFKGVRHVVHDEPDDDWIARKDVLRGLKEVERRGLSYDLLVKPQHLKHVEMLAKTCPALPLIIDHIAKPPIASKGMEPWKTWIQRVAKIERLHCKLSGMITEANWKSWRTEDLRPYAEIVIEAFGPERLTFGSDWPVCTLAGSYGRVFDAFQELVISLSDAERENIYHLNAKKFYNL